jgi:hypothetical protein
MVKFLHILALFCVKNANLFANFLAKIFKNNNIGPRSSWSRYRKWSEFAEQEPRNESNPDPERQHVANDFNWKKQQNRLGNPT